MRLETLTYESSDRVARITLNRPERGNGILVASAEGDMSELGGGEAPPGSPLDPATIGANHASSGCWNGLPGCRSTSW